MEYLIENPNLVVLFGISRGAAKEGNMGDGRRSHIPSVPSSELKSQPWRNMEWLEVEANYTNVKYLYPIHVPSKPKENEER